MKKTNLVFIIGAAIFGAAMFFVGTMYTDVRNSQLSYQVQLKISNSAFTDSIQVYDGKRYVGTIPLNYNESFAKLILEDNE